MAGKGELSLDQQAHLIACFVRDFGPYVRTERQRAVLDYIWSHGLGIKGIHGGLLSEARRRVDALPFAPKSEKLAYVRALLVLHPERDVHELLRGPVRHMYGESLHPQTVSALQEQLRQHPPDDVERARARDVIQRIEACKPHEEPSLL